MNIYSIILFSGFLQFYCKDLKCVFNDYGVCNFKYEHFPKELLNNYEKNLKIKKSVKCFYEDL